MRVHGVEKGTYYLVKVGQRFSFESFSDIKSIVESALAIGHHSIVFDMSECNHMSSLATGLVANICKKCAALGGRVGLLNPSARHQEVLSYTSLDGYVDICDSVQTLEAVF